MKTCSTHDDNCHELSWIIGVKIVDCNPKAGRHHHVSSLAIFNIVSLDVVRASLFSPPRVDRDQNSGPFSASSKKTSTHLTFVLHLERPWLSR